MSKPPPPPPLPNSSGEPSAVSGVGVAQEARPANPASPEDLISTMDFVNHVRSARGWDSLEALPEPQGLLARDRSLSLALGVSVIKHGDGGLLYALVYSDPEDMTEVEILTDAGGNLFQTQEMTRERKRFVHEVILPRYCYDLAG